MSNDIPIDELFDHVHKKWPLTAEQQKEYASRDGSGRDRMITGLFPEVSSVEKCFIRTTYDVDAAIDEYFLKAADAAAKGLK